MQLLEFEKPAVELERELEKLRAKSASQNIDMSAEISMMEAKLAETRAGIYENLTPWQRVQIARHTNRPFMLDYVSPRIHRFLRAAWRPPHRRRRLDARRLRPHRRRRVVVIGHQKGRDTKENLKRNFGSAHPEGYRKAMRLMKLAEKFGLPVITLIDTPAPSPASARRSATSPRPSPSTCAK
jgi:acetyl-CoA carboxylase carboxyl transferase subunit alpha